MTDTVPENGVQERRRVKQVEREYTDAVTGEVKRLVHEETLNPRRRPPDEKSIEPFTLTYHAEELAKHRMPGLCWSVLWHLVSTQGMGHEEVRYSTNDIARDIGSFPQKVSVALRTLEERGLIVERKPYARTLTLNPRYFWRGTPKARRSIL